MIQPNKDLLAIDRNNLELECEKQPQLAFEWGEQLAAASRRAKEARNSLKLAEAQIATEVRTRPGDYGLFKVTEDSVKQAVLLQSEYQQIQKELVIAEYEEDLLQQFCYAWSDRKKELENMVQLHGQMYFSRVQTTPREAAPARMRTMRDAAEQVRPPKR